MSEAQQQNMNGNKSYAAVVGGAVPPAVPVNVEKVHKFFPKQGKGSWNRKNGKNKQRDQQSQQAQPSQVPHSPQPAVAQPSQPSQPATFQSRLLQQMQDIADRNGDSTQEGTQHAEQVLTNEAQSISKLTGEVSLLNATVFTLRSDLARRDEELVKERASLHTKDLTIEELQKRVAQLEQSVQASSTVNQDELLAKDKIIMQLQYDNAGLRDSIHSGLFSIAQIYGPGSDQAFTTFATQHVTSSQRSADIPASGIQKPQSHQLKQHATPRTPKASPTAAISQDTELTQPQNNQIAPNGKVKVHKEKRSSKERPIAKEEHHPVKVQSGSEQSRVALPKVSKAKVVVADQPATEDPDGAQEVEVCRDVPELVYAEEGWVLRATKPSPKAKGKTNEQGTKRGKGTASKRPNAKNKVFKEKGTPKKKYGGLVIGSNSDFSRATNGNDQDGSVTHETSPDSTRSQKTPASSPDETGTNSRTVSTGSSNKSQADLPKTSKGAPMNGKLKNWADDVEESFN
ncbi:uncharacterized protein F4822DRAFT_191303 [Hypoxylon trugodes]|uniref:uncharacterized protein n=1 Tax=Hypoxylon trugodes TaxID=326681 RepID=UPI0021909462|nr:uncharacterized protein F4822DRAFT_191303 [Hypoxylon trugodes]KAI1391617.1 hypothetical protein F4822DRAFT_191303 [Hypoxylon trugodes]